MACPACQSPVAPQDRFCEACGCGISPVGQEAGGTGCTACGERTRGDQPEYCLSCGTKAPAVEDHLEADAGIVAAVSDRGRRHLRNEDAFAIAVAEGGRILAVVCDGVSTTARPERASRAAADAALGALVGAGATSHDLDGAYRAARRAVHQIPWVPEEERAGAPSCTFLAASVTGNEVRVASMGDCRAFWVPEVGEPTTLTQDDSWAAEEILAGRMTAEYLGRDPRSHAITRWLGRDAEPDWTPHLVSFSPAAAGRIVLCSDGLWNYADSADAIASVTPAGAPAPVARSLVDWANARGGQDNVTVVVLDVGPSDRTDTRQRGPAR